MKLNPWQHSRLPATAFGETTLRVATYNIHKGVRGLGPVRRLEIHNLGLAVEALDADVVFLQEVRAHHRKDAAHFDRTWFGWPDQGQAEFLAPEGYEVAYRTNARTRHGEHGNALLARWPLGEARHLDVSDHAFEQRGLLHAVVRWQHQAVHAIVAHLGLAHGTRLRQVRQLMDYVQHQVPVEAPLVIAGDFNDWAEHLDGPLRVDGLVRAVPPAGRLQPTFPSRMPMFALDRVYLRGLTCKAMHVPRGLAWARMSDHLPLVVDLAPAEDGS